MLLFFRHTIFGIRGTFTGWVDGSMDYISWNQSIVPVTANSQNVQFAITGAGASSVSDDVFYMSNGSNTVNKPAIIDHVMIPSSTFSQVRVQFNWSMNPGGSLGRIELWLGWYYYVPDADIGFTKYRYILTGTHMNDELSYRNVLGPGTSVNWWESGTFSDTFLLHSYVKESSYYYRPVIYKSTPLSSGATYWESWLCGLSIHGWRSNRWAGMYFSISGLSVQYVP